MHYVLGVLRTVQLMQQIHQPGYFVDRAPMPTSYWLLAASEPHTNNIASHASHAMPDPIEIAFIAYATTDATGATGAAVQPFPTVR
jgi:hypothetical protein